MKLPSSAIAFVAISDKASPCLKSLVKLLAQTLSSNSPKGASPNDASHNGESPNGASPIGESPNGKSPIGESPNGESPLPLIRTTILSSLCTFQ